MSGRAAVLDACTLVPIRLASTLLWLAEAGLFQPLWSEEILDEVERNLPKLGVEPARASRRVNTMREAFGAEALVDGFDGLIERMTCDPKDRHVLAAAVHDHADALVTFNLKDFPAESVEPHGIELVHPDLFLVRLLHERPTGVIDALDAGVRDLRKPPESLNDWLVGLTSTVSMFANLAADAARGPLESLSPMPALVQADDDAALRSMGEPGDLTNPAQVALIWYAGLLDGLEMAKVLTYDPVAWGDYQWAIKLAEGRSLASRVIPAVDAPGRVAYMRLLPEIAHTSRVFQSFSTTATIITLVRLDDGTWRVWGLGPGMPPAHEIIGAG